MKKSKDKIYICIFLFILIILFLSPISGDDWGNFLVGTKGFYHMIGQAVGMYFSWEGRFISRLLINILTYNKWLWNIINSFAIVGIVYYINKIVKFKNKDIMIVLTFSVLLFMNIFTFSQTITWIAGNITYLFVIPLLLMYFYIIYNKKDKNKINILLILLNIIIPMFVEHMAIVIILLNIYFIGKDYYKNKKINKKLILFLLISISSFALMYFSPGNSIRKGMENLEFNKLSIFGKVFYNIPNFINYTYIINYFLLPLLIIGNILLIKKHIKNKNIKIVLYLVEIISIIPTIGYLLKCFSIINIPILSEYNSFVIIYFLLLTIINFILLIKHKKELPILFYSIGIISNLVMLMSPTWGYRTSLATYLFLSICYLIILDEYLKKNKLINTIIISITVLGMLFYLIFYISIYRCHIDNEKTIYEAKKNNLDIIEINAYPGFAPCNINPTNEYHLNKFKEYYHIKDNVEIKIINKNWKYIIIYRKK